MRNVKRMTLQQLKTVEEGWGDGAPDNWKDVGPVAMQLKPLSGQELLVAQQMKSQVTTTGRCKYFGGADSQMRLKYGKRIFNVTSVVNEMERNKFLVWKLIEVSDGSQ